MKINQDLKNIVNTVCSAEGLENEFTNISINPTVVFNKDCVETVRQAADSFGYSYREIVSGAGHDAQMMARVCPTGMVFVPSHKGISHNPQEHTDSDDLIAGCNVLFQTILDLDMKDLGG